MSTTRAALAVALRDRPRTLVPQRTAKADRSAPAPALAGRWDARSLAVVAGVTGLVALSLVLRSEGMRTWYWIDEALSVGIASEPVLSIPGHLAGDGSPPLYYVLLHGWIQLFGSGEVATHALSLFFACAMVPVGYWSGRSLFDRRTGWIVATLTATAPFLTYFARETRMYTLVALLALVGVTCFVHVFVHDRRRYLGPLVAAFVLLVYTHHWGLYTVLAALVAMVPALLVAQDRRRLLRRGLVFFGAVGVAYLPWIVVLVGQLAETGAPWAYTPTARELISEISALFRDERVLGPLVLAGFGGLLPLLRQPKTSLGTSAWVLASFAVVPIAVGWGFAHVEPSWATRYLAVVVGPLLLVIGVGMARVGGFGLGALAIALLLWVQPLARLETGIVIPPGGKSNAKVVATALDTRLRPGDIVMVAQPEAVPLFEHYVTEDVAFVDLLGPRVRPNLMDWRGASERYADARLDEGLRPLIDELPVGGRIALVLPAKSLARTDTPWIRSFHAKGDRWDKSLRNDDRFVRLPRWRVSGDGSATTPFGIVVYERGSGSEGRTSSE